MWKAIINLIKRLELMWMWKNNLYSILIVTHTRTQRHLNIWLPMHVREHRNSQANNNNNKKTVFSDLFIVGRCFFLASWRHQIKCFDFIGSFSSPEVSTCFLVTKYPNRKKSKYKISHKNGEANERQKRAITIYCCKISVK